MYSSFSQPCPTNTSLVDLADTKPMDDTPGPAVSRLPPELLSAIFKTLAAIDPPTSEWTRKYPTKIRDRLFFHVRRQIGWISVSHVCCSWRIAAIGDAALWTSISGDLSMTWVAEMLHRSRGMPLMVSFETEDIILPAFIEEALAPAQQQRLKSLRLCPKQSSDRTILQQLKWPAPLLEELVVENSHHWDEIFRFADIFSSTLPRLRKLTLRGWVPNSWDVPYLCNLTSLTLKYTTSWLDEALNLSNTKWIEILRRCPKLETIEARGIIRGSLDADVLFLREHGQIVELPCLRKIEIEPHDGQRSIAGESLVFFDYLLVPPTCKVTLNLNSRYMKLPPFDTVFACLFNHASIYSPRQRSTASTQAHPSPMRLIITTRDYGIQDLRLDPQIHLTDETTFSVQWVHPRLEFEELLLHAVCTKMHLFNVVFLEFAGSGVPCTLGMDMLFHFLSSFPSVRTLILSTERIINIVSVLADSVIRDDDTVDSPPLPLLDRLVLKLLDLDKRIEGALETMGEIVVKMLQSRRSLGAEIKSVELVDCEGSEESAVSIRQCVSNFADNWSIGE